MNRKSGLSPPSPEKNQVIKIKAATLVFHSILQCVLNLHLKLIFHITYIYLVLLVFAFMEKLSNNILIPAIMYILTIFILKMYSNASLSALKNKLIIKE